MSIRAINPATGEIIEEHPPHDWNEVARRIDGAHQQFLLWRETSFAHRASRMRQVAELLERRKDRLAHLMAREMGKPVTQGRAEIEKCAWAAEWFAENAARLLAPEEIETDAMESFVSYQPLGVILAVMPWNFPFWQVMRFAAPALMAGNAAVLKHASSVPGCALAIEELFEHAGFPHGLFANLLIGSELVTRAIHHPRIAAVTVTGSTDAGRAIAEQAGAALKKTVLELGGSDPYLVLADADLSEAARICAEARLINSGQSCIAAKRFIVVDAVREKFERLFLVEMAKAKIGDPLDQHTTVGPLARRELRDQLHRQVTDSIARGAKLILGGSISDEGGAWYPPTILTDVRPGMPAFDEELFGPVAAIVPAGDEREAIELANTSCYGLGAAVFSEDLDRAREIAERRIEAGSCFVNSFVRSDPRLPFGGIKASGYGRELGAIGIREFVNVKTISIADARARKSRAETGERSRAQKGLAMAGLTLAFGALATALFAFDRANRR